MPGAKKPVKPRASKTTKKPAVTRKPVTTKVAAKRPQKTAVASDPRKGRRLRPARYQSLRLKKRIKHPVTLPSSWKIAKATRLLVFRNWKVIGGIVLVYGILNMILVRGLNGGLDVRELQNELNLFFSGTLGHLASGLSVFALLVGTSTSTSGASGSSAYQSILVLIVSMALIWAYRQLLADKKIRIRDAYYRGMYPLIPILLVLIVIGLQLIPTIIGGWVYSLVLQNGIAVSGLEKFLWGGIFFMLVLLSLYMICSSIFAFYIVTLANMTPMKALRSARSLVRHRRWTVMRKVLFLPLWLLIVGALFMLPFILFLPIAAQWIFFGVTMLSIAAFHGYMYTLYRELLREKA